MTDRRLRAAKTRHRHRRDSKRVNSSKADKDDATLIAPMQQAA
jgi:hypothetical protein